MIETFVEEVMSSPAEIVSPATPAAEAAERLRDWSIGSLVVVTDGDIEGIVVESDIAVLIADRRSPDLPIGKFMSAPVVGIEPTASIAAAAARMQDNGVKRLPVVDGDIEGMVTTTDVAYYLPRYRTQIVGE